MHPEPEFRFEYRRAPDQDRAAHHPVIVVGAGPVGLTLALDLDARGIPVVLLDDSDRIGEGSRGICYAKRTLEVWQRLGVARPVLEKGVVWKKGRVFHRDRELYDFDLLDEGGHAMPAFVNIQQYWVEKYLIDAISQRPGISLRWRNAVSAVERRDDGVIVTVDTPEGPYRLTCDWLVCCDGARSPTRAMLGLAFDGEVFDDQFLIADVRMTAPFPTERWFWFEPPFHTGQSALLHKQPDDVWRIDLQLTPDADTVAERQPDRVRERIRKMIGNDAFELVWVSVYRFQCRRLKNFVHGRVIFAGDAAHQVSPFGARGANSGIQDADNLAWKLAMTQSGGAGPDLIASYDIERGEAADDNIGHSTRATDFIAPRSIGERRLRDAALALAGSGAGFAKRFVNSGRLSQPTTYRRSALQTDDATDFAGSARPGAPLPDAPVMVGGRRGWLLDQVGRGFAILTSGPELGRATLGDVPHLYIGSDLADPDGHVASRLDMAPGTTYVVRPDQHVAARMRTYNPGELAAALRRAKGYGA